MKVNTSALKDGDVFFIRSISLSGLLIQLITGIGSPTHVGKILIKDGESYTVEMIGDFVDDNDLIIQPLSYYTKKSRFWIKLLEIKRPFNYILGKPTIPYNDIYKEYTAKRVDYDWKEILSFVKAIFSKKAKDENKNKIICSRLVYDIDKKAGVVFTEKELKKFDDMVSPADLYKSKAYVNIPNWRQKDEDRLQRLLHKEFYLRRKNKKPTYKV